MNRKVVFSLLILLVLTVVLSCDSGFGLGLIDPEVEKEFAVSLKKNDTDTDTGSRDEVEQQEDTEDEATLRENNTATFLEYMSNREGDATVVYSYSFFGKAYNLTFPGTGELNSTGRVFIIDVDNIGTATYEFYRLVSYDDDTKAYYKQVSYDISSMKFPYTLAESDIMSLLTDYYALECISDDEQKLYIYANDDGDPDGNNLDFYTRTTSLALNLTKVE